LAFVRKRKLGTAGPHGEKELDFLTGMAYVQSRDGRRETAAPADLMRMIGIIHAVPQGAGLGSTPHSALFFFHFLFLVSDGFF
jgi:hypothetical protein